MILAEFSGKYRLVRVPYNIELQEYREVVNPKTKETRMEWKPSGYYGNISSAVKAIPDKIVYDDSLQTFSEIVEQIKLLADDMQKSLGELEKRYGSESRN